MGSQRGQVVFSVRDADASHHVSWDARGGENCERIGDKLKHETYGAQCSMNYPFRQGEKFTLGIVMSDGGRRMTGTVTDRDGFMTIIGTLVFPDLTGFYGFGLLQHHATGSLEYAGGSCETTMLTAVGMTGPFWNQ